MSLILFGMGGGATSLILGRFHLGPLSITVEEYLDGGSRRRKIKFLITYKDLVWKQTYKINTFGKILITVLAIASKISKGIEVRASNMKAVWKKIRIKVK